MGGISPSWRHFVFRRADVLDENWATLWEALADAQPDHTAVVIGEQHMTWRSLDDRASRLADHLDRAGIGHDAKVAQLMFNCPEYLESAYAAFKVRASTVNVNYRYKAPEIVHVLTDSGSTALVYHAAFREVVDEVRVHMPELKVLIEVGDETPAIGAVAYERAMSESQPMPRIARSGADSLLLYTGGTTGLPKGVVWSHRGLFGALAFTGYATLGLDVPETPEEVARVAVDLQKSGRGPVNMTAPPLMHGTAMFLAFSTFVLGGTVVLLSGRRFDPAELLTLVERERVSQISIVGDAFARPIIAEMERVEDEGRAYDLVSLGRIVSTGATLSSESKRALMARSPNAVVLDMIGASEGGPFAVAMTMPGQDPVDTAKFMATPNTVLFDDVTWEKIPFGSGRSGVLAAAGSMPDGYFGDPEKTSRTFREIDGVRYSIPGDYAIIDADGTVQLLGRGSVCINSGGEKIYPEEVEVAARSHDEVVDCVAVGLPDERFGEIVGLVVSRTNGSTLDEDAVIAHVKKSIADYKAPRRVVFVPEIYRSPSGKADYRWAKEQTSS
jgi:acyl-CoA synthetase (AMP-forming)/AMP-acid ligase II